MQGKSTKTLNLKKGGIEKMSGLLQDKSILVIGGTKGVGRGICESCAREGAKLVIGGRDEAAAVEIIDAVKGEAAYEPVFIKTDVTDLSGLENVVKQTEEKNGRIDGFVYYSGILPSSYICETSEDLFDNVFDINVKGAFFATQAVLNSMKKTGGGSIIYTGSAHAYGGEEDRGVYSVSKGALLTLMKHVSKHFMKYKIRSNWITMGWVATPGELALRASQGHDLAWLEKEAAAATPVGRLLTVEDHVPGVLYLLSDASSVVTGTELQITGGFVT
ncbi:SDR family NAD(P)-dependent oxidoreductase [Christensenella hongkongensis]|uniref:SDR family NAD(P)-dependent oxidoreductase n=1 Tax=Christensenella hongkongensis TaxID=270498 RepID=UPI002A75DA19|nr:SDR family oxidoreductase [Christensenella hongkongensis]